MIHRVKPCARGLHCVDPERDAQGNSVPRFTQTPFCTKDTQQISQVLTEAHGLWQQLSAALPKGSRRLGEHVSGSKAPPIPIRLEVLTQMELLKTLVEDHAALVRGHTLPNRRMEVVVVQDSEYLRVHLSSLLAKQYGVVAGLSLLDWRSTARRLLGLNRYVEKRKAPCPQCDAMALMRKDGEENSICKVCGIVITQSEYQRWVLWITNDLDK